MQSRHSFIIVRPIDFHVLIMVVLQFFYCFIYKFNSLLLLLPIASFSHFIRAVIAMAATSINSLKWFGVIINIHFAPEIFSYSF